MKNIKFKYIFKSFSLFFLMLFKKVKYDVVFYYPSHFNQSGKMNLFFLNFYETCKKNKLQFCVIEEPCFVENEIRCDDVIPFDAFFILIYLLRKLLPIKLFNSHLKKEWFIGKIIKLVTFNKLKSLNYIVISNSMISFFRGYSSSARIFDYQHGINFIGHTGYFDSGSIPHRAIIGSNVELLLFGRGFKDAIVDGENCYYKTNSHVVGFKRNLKFRDTYSSKIILVSLQLGLSKSEEERNLYNISRVEDNVVISLISKFLCRYEDFFEKNTISVLLKHHPRRVINVDLSEVLRYDFVSLWHKSLHEALEISFLHFTLFSTATFDAANYGIPSVIYANDMSKNIFDRQYKYPLGLYKSKSIVKKIEKYFQNKESYLKDARLVHEWYNRYYQPYDEDKFIELMTTPRGCPSFNKKESEIC